MRDRTIPVPIAIDDSAPHIGEQLASIAGPSLLPDELVVSDDGSRDDTPAIVAAFARTAPFPVRLIRQPPQLGILENCRLGRIDVRGGGKAEPAPDGLSRSRPAPCR